MRKAINHPSPSAGSSLRIESAPAKAHSRSIIPPLSRPRQLLIRLFAQFEQHFDGGGSLRNSPKPNIKINEKQF
jgi:hypothetical protein